MSNTGFFCQININELCENLFTNRYHFYYSELLKGAHLIPLQSKQRAELTQRYKQKVNYSDYEAKDNEFENTTTI